MKHSFFAVLSVLLLSVSVMAQDSLSLSDTLALEAEQLAVAAPTDSAAENAGWIGKVEGWYAGHMNYGSIVALMTIESSFIPFPSEVVIPPAAYVANNPESSLYATSSYPLNILLIVLFGTLGAMLGALINYALSVWLGRPVLYRFADSKLGHLCLLSSDKLKKAEDYFNDHGKVSTLIGRFIPGIRQLISIPAGLARMNIGAFLGYTFLGAFAWNVILALLGYLAQGQADVIEKYNHELSLIILALVALAAVYVVVRIIVKRRKKQNA